MTNNPLESKISVKLNGNRIRIPQGENLSALVEKRLKLQKLLTVTVNNESVPPAGLGYQLSAGDEIFIQPKTRDDFAKERIGLRTRIRYAINSFYASIEWRIRRALTGGKVFRRTTDGGKEIVFLANSRETIFRSNFSQKEPDLIAWLDRLGPEDTLLDIGANVGAVSLYAAVGRGSRIICCEPNSRNFRLLVEHIALNDLTSSVCPLNLAVSKESSIAALYIKNPDEGASGNSFSRPMDQSGRSYEAVKEQSCLGVSLDDLVSLVGSWSPNYLKIDVDGFEDLVLAGASDTLKRGILKSICVEIDLLRPRAKDEIVGLLQSYDYRLRSIGGEKTESGETVPDRGRLFNFIFDKPELQ